MSHLPIHILGQAPNMGEIKDDPVEATLPQGLAPATILAQPRRINAVQYFCILLFLEFLDMGLRC